MLTHGWLSVLFVIIATYVFLLSYWRKFRAIRRPFNYRITDLWAAIIGLLPTVIAAAVVSEYNIRDHSLGYSINAVLVLGLLQIAGLSVGRMDIDIRAKELGPVTAWSSAVSIVGGAALGATLALIVYAYITHA